MRRAVQLALSILARDGAQCRNRRGEVDLVDAGQNFFADIRGNAADLGRLLAAAIRERDLFRAAIALDRLARDQALLLEPIEKSDERRALDLEGDGQFRLREAIRLREQHEHTRPRQGQAAGADAGVE